MFTPKLHYETHPGLSEQLALAAFLLLLSPCDSIEMSAYGRSRASTNCSLVPRLWVQMEHTLAAQNITRARATAWILYYSGFVKHSTFKILNIVKRSSV